MIGLLAVQVLKARGLSFICAVDLDRERLELALSLGADDVLSSRDCDIPAEILKRTGGLGVDVVIEAVGLFSTVSTALACVRKGGAVSLVGNLTQSIELPLQKVVARELTLYGSCASAGEYPQCLEMLTTGAVKVDKLLSASAPLAEGPSWFARLYRGEKGLVKVCLLP
jgi:L-iditol 2-dehydrogenase